MTEYVRKDVVIEIVNDLVGVYDTREARWTLDVVREDVRDAPGVTGVYVVSSGKLYETDHGDIDEDWEVEGIWTTLEAAKTATGVDPTSWQDWSQGGTLNIFSRMHAEIGATNWRIQWMELQP